MKFNDYIVYFKIGDKKLKKTVYASNEREAQKKVLRSIEFVKTKIKPDDKRDPLDKINDLLKDIFN